MRTSLKAPQKLSFPTSRFVINPKTVDLIADSAIPM
jgi:hypothetical protein